MAAAAVISRTRPAEAAEHYASACTVPWVTNLNDLPMSVALKICTVCTGFWPMYWKTRGFVDLNCAGLTTIEKVATI